MPIDSLVRMLACVKADGRSVSHALIIDAAAGATRRVGRSEILTRITISGLVPGDIVLVPDEAAPTGGAISRLLSTTSGTDQNRMCDGIIVRKAGENDGSIVFDIGYFDLKSGNPSGYEGQFISAQCFFKSYVISILKSFYAKNCRIGKERFVVLHTDKSGRAFVRKPPTRPTRDSANRPGRAVKLIVEDGQTVSRSQIIG